MQCLLSQRVPTQDDGVIKKHRIPNQTETDEQMRLVLPYSKGLSEKICMACRPLSVLTVFKSSTTLRNLFTHVMTPTAPEERKVMVYQIPCECGSVYIGETGKQHWRDRKAALQNTRQHCRTQGSIAEHKAAVRQANINKAIASHVWNSCHAIQWSETSVLEHEAEWYRRRVKEALYIRSSSYSEHRPGPSLEPMLGYPKTMTETDSPPPPPLM